MKIDSLHLTMLALSLWLSACGGTSVRPTCAPDCGPHASCVVDGAEASCICDSGFVGDGLVCVGSTTDAMVEMDAGSTDAATNDAGDAAVVDAGDSGALDAGADALVDAGACTATNLSKVDLVFMVDDSGSMREEQLKLRREFPRMVRALVTGDVDADGTVDGPAVESLRIAIVTSDMGVAGVGTRVGEQAISTCGAVAATVDVERASYGDDGVFVRRGTSVAASAAEPTALDCDADDDGAEDVITSGALPAYLTFDRAQVGNAAALDEYVRRVSCMASPSTQGCAFEQQLESVLKAITPANETPTGGPFYTAPGDTARQTGHGCVAYLPDGACDLAAQGADVANAGWFRQDALLGIVMITDEDDCSTDDPRAFDFSIATGPYADPYTRFQAQTRCPRFEADLLHPVQRFVDGILARRPNAPERIVFAVITGVPPTLVDEPDEGSTNIQAILDDPAMQTTYQTLPRPAGPGNSIVDVPYAAIADACRHVVPVYTYVGTATTVEGGTQINGVTLAGGAPPFVGMGLAGSAIATGTLVTAVSGSGPYSLTVDLPATASTQGGAIRAIVYDVIGTATTASGSSTLTNVTFAGGVVPTLGMALSGPGIPSGALVYGATGSGPYTITISTPATATASDVTVTARTTDVSAVPARRIIGVARGLSVDSQDRVTTLVQSICVDDFRPSIERVLNLVQGNLAGSCVP